MRSCVGESWAVAAEVALQGPRSFCGYALVVGTSWPPLAFVLHLS